jgi:hypothetical protein
LDGFETGLVTSLLVNLMAVAGSAFLVAGDLKESSGSKLVERELAILLLWLLDVSLASFMMVFRF